MTDVTANDGMWHHVCVTWQSDSGLWSIYLDGVLIDHGLSLSANSSIQGWLLYQPSVKIIAFLDFPLRAA